MVDTVYGCHPFVPLQRWSCVNVHLPCVSCQVYLAQGLRTSHALGRWDCPRLFQAVVLRPLPRKGQCAFLKRFIAVLHTCFAVGCCSLAGKRIVACSSLPIWSTSSNPVGTRTLFLLIIRWGLGSSHSIRTAEVQRYLG